MQLTRGVVAVLFATASAVGCGRLGFERYAPTDVDAASEYDGDSGQSPQAPDGMQPSDHAGRDAAVVDGGNTPDVPGDTGSDAGDEDPVVPPIDAGPGSDDPLDAGLDPDDESSFDAGSDAGSAVGSDAGADPEPITPNYPTVATISLSSVASHTCVTRSGDLYCWGDNSFGQIGNDTTDTQNSPLHIDLPHGESVVQVSAGETHTCAIADVSGALYCWGDNQWGQLGLGDDAQRDVPTRVTNVPPVLQVSAGYGFTCAITHDNNLWCWGSNSEGQFGLDDTSDAIEEDHLPRPSGDSEDWLQVSTGQGRTCGIRHPGQLWCAGRNSTFGLGTGSNVPAEIRAWTRVENESDWTRISVSQDGACGLRNDVHAYCWGTFPSSQPFVSGSPVFIDDGGNAFAQGSAGVFNMCGVQGDGRMLCWGRNSEGQLGTGDTSDHVFVTILEDSDWHSVVLGRFHTCAQKTNGEIWCTGSNDSGQLGLGDYEQRTSMTFVTFP